MNSRLSAFSRDGHEPGSVAFERLDLIGRLSWRYGRKRALAIVRAQDTGASQDLQAWRKFGVRP